MTPDFTFSIAATHTRTGVVAMEIPAGHIRGTVWVDDTFGFALNIRISLVFRRARTDTVIADFSGNCATAARVGVAGVRYDGFRFKRTADERIAHIIW